MVLHHGRKLMPEICESIYHVDQNCFSSNCDGCLKLCLTNPQYYYYYSQPPAPISPFPLDDTSSNGTSHALSTYLVLALSVSRSRFLRRYLLRNLRHSLSKRRRSRSSIRRRRKLWQLHELDPAEEEKKKVVTATEEEEKRRRRRRRWKMRPWGGCDDGQMKKEARVPFGSHGLHISRAP
ncbi:hypothetical protein PIB30_000035 [Stylosanthes scabra]|uniref:Uncharacterized protein n=1 Tax=Stylosanthes scabra TaxID=79078 RepID=A0ABU6Q1W7_9FABA|nr:hypothetical protein [Stylosanthes scabra]